MCIIIIKPRGVELPKEEIFAQCEENNPHGAGFMIALGGDVYIDKGFKDYKKLLSNLNGTVDNIVDHTAVIHFRVATHGLVNKSNCHPFPLSDNEKDLRSLKSFTPIGFAHNGVFRWAKIHSTLSDTQMAVKSVFHNLNWNDLRSKKIQACIIALCRTDNIVFLHKSGVRIQHGDWEEQDGILYSNTSYKSRWISRSRLSSDDKYGIHYSRTTTQIVGRSDKRTAQVNQTSIIGDVYSDYQHMKTIDQCEICGQFSRWIIKYEDNGREYLICIRCEEEHEILSVSDIERVIFSQFLDEFESDEDMLNGATIEDIEESGTGSGQLLLPNQRRRRPGEEDES